MRLTPKPLEIGETDGFTPENDLFGYGEFGERLANLVCNVEEPVTLLLEGPWGSGKSTFAKQWAGLLRRNSVPVIVFDAFANDYQEDAFTALVTQISTTTPTLTGDEGITLRAFKEKAAKAGRVLLPLAAKLAIKVATLNALSSDDLKHLSDEAKGIIGETADSTGGLALHLIEERIEHANADRESLEAFRESLKQLAEQLTAQESADNQRNGPLVIVVDELDRCRPSFALDLLEHIKHLFSVDGICFVLVSNLPQLESVVRGTYGSGTDASTYLEKFFHLKIHLPDLRNRGYSARRNYIDHLWRSVGLDSGDPGYDGDVRGTLLSLANAYGLSLRTIERVVSHVALVYMATNNKYLRIVALVLPLCLMRQVEPQEYRKATKGELTWPDARTFLRLEQWGSSQGTQHYKQWWRVATDTDENLADESWASDMTTSLIVRYEVSRKDLLPVLCRLIDDLKLVDS